MIARHPSDPDNAARAKMRADGFLPLGDWARTHGIAYDTAYKRCQAGTLPHTEMFHSYWIAPGVSA